MVRTAFASLPVVLWALAALSAPAESWAPSRFSTHARHASATALRSSQEGDGRPSEKEQDLNGKLIVERTLFRLSPGSRVAVPNALILEERRRYLPNPDRPGYVLPTGPRTWILREGDEDEECVASTAPLYRLDHGPSPHTGSSMEPTIATALFLASNPQLVQGSLMELDCGASGVASLVGCVGAAAVAAPDNFPEEAEVHGGDPLSVTHVDKTLLPAKLHKITLTDADGSQLDQALHNVNRARVPKEKIRARELKWKGYVRRQQRRMIGSPTGEHYRTIVGSDVDLSYPIASDLARVVAHCLLPSNPEAIATSESSDAGTAFGALGMDVPSAPTKSGSMGIGIDDAEESADSKANEDKEAEIDPTVPPAFVFVCPDAQPDLPYLRQFLERGFRMDVRNHYVKLQKYRCDYLILPEDTPEQDMDDMDLFLLERVETLYEGLTAVHHPEFGGAGTEEAFFPIENGSYQGGGTTYSAETETEGGSLLE